MIHSSFHYTLFGVSDANYGFILQNHLTIFFVDLSCRGMNTPYRLLSISIGMLMITFVTPPVFAWPDFTIPTIPVIDFPSPTPIKFQQIDPGKLTVSIMPMSSVTPSTAPTSTPTTAPTQTPTVITATPEIPSTPSQLPTPDVTISPTPEEAQISTSSATHQQMTDREKVILGIAALAVASLLGVIAWPKIKPWLHEKTG